MALSEHSDRVCFQVIRVRELNDRAMIASYSAGSRCNEYRQIIDIEQIESAGTTGLPDFCADAGRVRFPIIGITQQFERPRSYPRRSTTAIPRLVLAARRFTVQHLAQKPSHARNTAPNAARLDESSLRRAERPPAHIMAAPSPATPDVMPRRSGKCPVADNR